MNNSYLSNEPAKFVRQKYLRMDIFNYETLAFRDYSVIAESEIWEDIYVSQSSTFIIPSKYHYFGIDGQKKEKVKIQFEQGDIVRVKNEYGKLVFTGIIFSIEDFEPVESAKITCRPIVSILDTKLIYNGFKDQIVAEEMKSLLLKNLKGEGVKAIEKDKFNRKYIKVEIDNDVKVITGSIPFEKPKEIILWDFFRTLYDNFELYLQFSMQFNDGNTENYLIIKITKNKKIETERTRLKNNFADLQNLVVDDLYKQTPNRIDIYKEIKTGKFEIDKSFILLKKWNEKFDFKRGTVINLDDTDKETDERMHPTVIKTVLLTEIIKDKDKELEDEKDENKKEDIKKRKVKDYAIAQLKGNTYSHMIEFDLVRTTKIIDVSTIKLYDKFILYINGKVYETVLSGIKQNYERSNLTKFIFGKARFRFNDKMKLSNIFEK